MYKRQAYFNVTEEQRQAHSSSRRKHYQGLPITSVALIIPIVYQLRRFFPEEFPYIYVAMLAVIAFLFVFDFKVFKPDKKCMLCLLYTSPADRIHYRAYKTALCGYGTNHRLLSGSQPDRSGDICANDVSLSLIHILQNATSVASTLLTTESVVANIKEEAPAMPAGAPAGMGMM